MRRLGAESIPDISGGERLRLAWLGDGLEPVAAAPAAQSPEVPPPDWAHLPAPAERRPFRPLAPSRIEFPGMVEPPVRSPATAENAGRFRRGRAMHTLLQRLPDIDPARRARAALRLLPGFDADERAEMVAQALAVIEDPACARFFGPGSLAEAPIVGRIGQRGVAGQIDRLLVEPTAVTIVDFKSGRIPEGGADHVPSAYLAQMAAYRAVLRQIYPARAIHLVLIWTDGPMAVPLDPAALDPFERYLTSVIADPPSPT
jgi:ATP-dependent helicase/nuclease subunit A